MFNRKLGRNGPEVSAMGLGCWAIGGDSWGQVDDGESIRAIHSALDMGLTFLDTADAYGRGHSERVLARALENKRDQVVIATKFGNGINEKTGQKFGPVSEPDTIRQACEASLRRLNTDYIDLYQFHINDYDPAKAPDVLNVLEELVASGKIRSYGWSTDFPDRAYVFAEGTHCAAIQQRLNVFEGNQETLAVCEEFELASINRGPLAMGLLTGKFTADSQLPSGDIRGRNMAWVKPFRDGKPRPEWLEMVEAIRDILTSEGRTPAQGALGWIWARSNQTIPIPGFKTVKQAQENVAAMEFGALTTEQMSQIDALLKAFP